MPAPALRYGMVVIAIACATLLQWTLHSYLLGVPAPFFWIAIIGTGYWIGDPPAVLAVVVAACVYKIVVRAPGNGFLEIGLFLCAGVLFCGLEQQRTRLIHRTRDAEQRFGQVSNQALVGIWMSDPAGTFVHINNWMAQYCEAGHLTLHPDDAAPVMQALRGTAATRREVRVRCAGSWRWCMLISVPRVANGHFAGHSGVLFDTEARHEAETEVRRLIDERNSFAAVISHELRTPLTTILGNVALLEEGLPAPVPDVDHESLIAIRRAAQQLQEHIENVLAYRQVHSGESRPDWKPVDLSMLVASVAGELAPDARSHGLTVLTDLTYAPTGLISDPVKLRYALRALLSNAIKFTRDGSVTLRVREESDRIDITIEDTGIGMDMADARKVGEPFWQARQALVRETGGMGLGVALARGFVESMGGDIRWESTEGLGSTFTVSLQKRAV